MNVTILIASHCSDSFTAWKEGLKSFGTIAVAQTLGATKEALSRNQPDLLLLDTSLPELEGGSSIPGLMELSTRTRVVTMNEEVEDDRELALFRQGVRGCCPRNIAPERLKSVVLSVSQGELWIRRTLTIRLLDELSARIRENSDSKRIAATRLADLTRREREIAGLIGNGESNKQIARQLTITERTVKAHLTEIFRKLGISDRLKLALLVAELPGN